MQRVVNYVCIIVIQQISIRKDKSLDDTLTFSYWIYSSYTEGCVYLDYHRWLSSKEIQCSVLPTMHKRAHT